MPRKKKKEEDGKEAEEAKEIGRKEKSEAAAADVLLPESGKETEEKLQQEEATLEKEAILQEGELLKTAESATAVAVAPEEEQEKIAGLEKEPEEAVIEKKAAVTEERHEAAPEHWIPKTELGKKVLSGKITDIDYIFSAGLKIAEPEIIDMLVPNLNSDIILIGGSTGKGGGIRRTPIKRTARMHKSGRRYAASALVAVGNSDGYTGLGFASGDPAKQKDVMNKALGKAKLNLIPVRRGCGSWECTCGKPHSIPLAVAGKSGSVVVDLKPAPKGIGLCASQEVAKLLRLAGIKDIWSKTRGQTQSRVNLIKAVFNALKKLDKFKLHPEQQAAVKVGRE